MRRRPATRRLRAAIAGVAIAIAAGWAAACSGPRSGASATSAVSGCAAVLPLAHDIVHGQGSLIRVRRITSNDVDTLARELGGTPSSPPRQSAKTCLVVYHGDYPPGLIAGVDSPAVSGHYALLVIRVRHPAVDRVFVTDTLPAHLPR